MNAKPNTPGQTRFGDFVFHNPDLEALRKTLHHYLTEKWYTTDHAGTPGLNFTTDRSTLIITIWRGGHWLGRIELKPERLYLILTSTAVYIIHYNNPEFFEKLNQAITTITPHD